VPIHSFKPIFSKLSLTLTSELVSKSASSGVEIAPLTRTGTKAVLARSQIVMIVIHVDVTKVANSQTGTVQTRITDKEVVMVKVVTIATMITIVEVTMAAGNPALTITGEVHMVTSPAMIVIIQITEAVAMTEVETMGLLMVVALVSVNQWVHVIVANVRAIRPGAIKIMEGEVDTVLINGPEVMVAAPTEITKVMTTEADTDQ